MPQTLATVAAKLGGESWTASHTRRAIGSDSGDLDLDFDDVFGKPGSNPGSREEGGALSAAPSAEVSMDCRAIAGCTSQEQHTGAAIGWQHWRLQHKHTTLSSTCRSSHIMLQARGRPGVCLTS